MTGFILMDSPDASNIQQLGSILPSKYGASGMDEPNTGRSDLRLRPRGSRAITCIGTGERSVPEINVNRELLFVQIGRYLAKVTSELYMQISPQHDISILFINGGYSFNVNCAT